MKVAQDEVLGHGSITPSSPVGAAELLLYTNSKNAIAQPFRAGFPEIRDL